MEIHYFPFLPPPIIIIIIINVDNAINLISQKNESNKAVIQMHQRQYQVNCLNIISKIWLVQLIFAFRYTSDFVLNIALISYYLSSTCYNYASSCYWYLQLKMNKYMRPQTKTQRNTHNGVYNKLEDPFKIEWMRTNLFVPRGNIIPQEKFGALDNLICFVVLFLIRHALALGSCFFSN